MKKLAIVLVAAAFFTSCNSDSTTSVEHENGTVTQTEISEAPAVTTIGSQEAKDLLAQNPDVVVLDVRTPEEYASGHLKNAQLINFNAPDFNEQLKSLDKDKTYLVHCASGNRSGKATKTMEQMGFKQVYDATEGFAALKSNGLEVE
jgi:phage shock protein E